MSYMRKFMIIEVGFQPKDRLIPRVGSGKL